MGGAVAERLDGAAGVRGEARDVDDLAPFAVEPVVRARQVSVGGHEPRAGRRLAALAAREARDLGAALQVGGGDRTPDPPGAAEDEDAPPPGHQATPATRAASAAAAAPPCHGSP
ncbi:hypothetical protein GCM10010968_19350 [Agrococcus terreus]|uniref:Uncharacterized protein n=1 Tax=Agrococcus terreus TaxID=574649 RepID=A0ABQ2KMS6_9MICO|nr:hypothetical protein GCM10010968_19350 [Agrococcus terreus]